MRNCIYVVYSWSVNQSSLVISVFVSFKLVSLIAFLFRASIFPFLFFVRLYLVSVPWACWSWKLSFYFTHTRVFLRPCILNCLSPTYQRLSPIGWALCVCTGDLLLPYCESDSLDRRALSVLNYGTLKRYKNQNFSFQRRITQGTKVKAAFKCLVYQYQDGKSRHLHVKTSTLGEKSK